MENRPIMSARELAIYKDVMGEFDRNMIRSMNRKKTWPERLKISIRSRYLKSMGKPVPDPDLVKFARPNTLSSWLWRSKKYEWITKISRYISRVLRA